MNFRHACFVTLALLLAACTSPHDLAHEIATRAGMQQTLVSAPPFMLTTYARITQSGAPLVIYIEGDGLAWRSRTEPSPDPTPRHSVGLSLAVLDPSPNVAYIARPCQFTQRTQDSYCTQEYWTNKRFSPEVVASAGKAIDYFVVKTRSPAVHLVGYSGGAAVAVLVAAQRNDIASLRTVAGNLNTEGVNQYHKVSAMPESLNPILVAPKLAHIPQEHFVGALDGVIPPHIAEGFINALGRQHHATLRRVEQASHDQGWQNIWPQVAGIK